MAYIEFLQSQIRLKGKVKPQGDNLVEMVFEHSQEANTNGFRLYNDPQGKHDIGGDSYLGFTTLYRQLSDRDYILSNDGSIYIPPVYTQRFVAGEGGKLIGKTEQVVDDYSKLVIPVVEPDAGYKFDAWNPEIPASGKVDSNNSFYANFKFVPHVIINEVEFTTVDYAPYTFTIDAEYSEVVDVVSNATSYVELETMQEYVNLEFVSCIAVENGVTVTFRQKTDTELLNESVTEIQLALAENYETQAEVNDNVELAIAEIYELIIS